MKSKKVGTMKPRKDTIIWYRYLTVFRIRIRMDPHSIGRLDPDPGGLKRAKMKKKRSRKPDN
jgi:hypothetical protein